MWVVSLVVVQDLGLCWMMRCRSLWALMGLECLSSLRRLRCRLRCLWVHRQVCR